MKVIEGREHRILIDIIDDIARRAVSVLKEDLTIGRRIAREICCVSIEAVIKDAAGVSPRPLHSSPISDKDAVLHLDIPWFSRADTCRNVDDSIVNEGGIPTSRIISDFQG